MKKYLGLQIYGMQKSPGPSNYPSDGQALRIAVAYKMKISEN